MDSESGGARDSIGVDEGLSVVEAPPLVSVLMTSYNREDYIARVDRERSCADLHGLRAHRCGRLVEDGTVEVVTRYLRDPRVRSVCNERNLGDYPNRNHASTFARGEFMKYHDSDDVMYPNCLEIMVRGLQAFPSAAFALSGNRGWPGGQVPMLLTPRMSYQREFLGSGLFNQGPRPPCSGRARFIELGRFPVAGVHSDTQFWVTACARRSIVLAQVEPLLLPGARRTGTSASGPFTLAAR